MRHLINKNRGCTGREWPTQTHRFLEADTHRVRDNFDEDLAECDDLPRVLIPPYLRNASARNTKPVLTANEEYDRENRDIVKGKTRFIPK
ncbi:hypothetical protein CGLAMM_11510 [Acetobacteraceae bacterium EV16G]